MDEERLKLKRRLQDFQVERLKGTYRDFLEDTTFRPLCAFFMDHLYSSDDHRSRDESFLKLARSFEDLLGKEVLHTVSRLLLVHDLSERLDDGVVEGLARKKKGLDFTMAEYEQVYLEADRYADRVLQIELLVEAVGTVHRIAHYPLIWLLLKTLYAGAVVIGATPMVDFLQDGYEAFKSVADPSKFTEAIRDREMVRLNRIYGVT